MAEDQNREHLSLIRRVTSACESRGVRIWLLGGWGVDALCGAVRRAHHDVDFIARLSDREACRRLAGSVADEIPEDTPQKLRFLKSGIQCDTRFFYVLPDGAPVSDLDAHDPLVYPWPADSFPEQPNGILEGTALRAVSWSAQFVAKAGFSRFREGVPLREKDEADLAVIRGHLGAGVLEELERHFPGIPKGGSSTGEGGHACGSASRAK
jgi:hypothetical protein